MEIYCECCNIKYSCNVRKLCLYLRDKYKDILEKLVERYKEKYGKNCAKSFCEFLDDYEKGIEILYENDEKTTKRVEATSVEFGSIVSAASVDYKQNGKDGTDPTDSD